MLIVYGDDELPRVFRSTKEVDQTEKINVIKTLKRIIKDGNSKRWLWDTDVSTAKATTRKREACSLLNEFAKEKFLPFIQASSLDGDTKRYYETGQRLLSETPAKNWRIDQIKGSEAEMLSFTGSGANANCGLRTLRCMLSLAHDWEMIDRKPRIRLRKEVERTAVFDAEMEKRLLEKAPQSLRDVFLISHDAGLRPDEVLRMRWENVLWKKNLIFVPDGQTENAKRYVPLSDRVRELLRTRQATAGSP